MTIKLTLNGTDCAIQVNTDCCIPVVYGTNQDKSSKNFGQPTEKQLGFFTSISKAALRLVREQIATSDEEVDLREFATRTEQLNAELTEQLKAYEIY
jgi:hypothetical protein